MCDRALSGLARFIECGLKTTVEPLKDAEFHQPSGTVHFSSSLNKTLYVVKLNVALPVVSNTIYDTPNGNVLSHIFHLAFLIKSLHQPGLFEGACDKQDLKRSQDQSGEIRTEKLNANGYTMDGKDQRDVEQTMSELRGPILNRGNKTLVCFSKHDYFNINEAERRVLVCMDDLVHQGDKEAIRKVRSSPCFDPLRNIRFHPNRAENLNRSNRPILWAERLGVLTSLLLFQVSGFYLIFS